MLGLAAYSSSEDESADERPSHPPRLETRVTKPSEKPETQQPASNVVEVPNQPVEDSTGPLLGPFIPQDRVSPAVNTQPESQSRASSPFSSARALIRDMTLPPAPSFDIPPSPPGSPDPVANKKFEHFLALKKDGLHFNEKLASSSSLRNPSLLSKMMEHAGIDGKAQYATSLPTDIWDVSALPAWAFKEELNKSQQDIRRKFEEKRNAHREAIDFVSGGTSAESSRAGTPAGGGKLRQSAAERIMSGLSRESKLPRTTETGRRHELDRRPRLPEQGAGQKRHRSRSPSGRRRRSRSR